MTLRPILKAMPRYKRPQRASTPSSYTNYSSSPAATTPTPPDLPFTSVSPSPPNSTSPSASPRTLHLSSLPSPCLRPALLSPHVHFPPTPAICSTQLTHSPSTYDRAPIEVSPNSCELPERGGRMYNISSPDSVCHAPRTKPLPKGSYFHPNAFEACEAETEDPSPMSSLGTNYRIPSSQFLQVPPLVHDLSSSGSSSCSESEDSDALSPNPCINSSFNSSSSDLSYSHPYHPYPLSNAVAQEELAHALSFLPYSPSKGKYTDAMDISLKQKTQKRHSRRTLRGDQTPKLSRRCSAMSDEWDSAKLDGCLGGF